MLLALKVETNCETKKCGQALEEGKGTKVKFLLEPLERNGALASP